VRHTGRESGIALLQELGRSGRDDDKDDEGEIAAKAAALGLRLRLQ